VLWGGEVVGSGVDSKLTNEWGGGVELEVGGGGGGVMRISR